MLSVLWLALGLFLGVAFVRFARRKGSEGELFVFAVGLVVAALIYVGFAIVGGEPRWMVVEAAGAVLFGLLALAGLRVWSLLVAIGWVAHVAWDVGLHLVTPRSFVGAWYPTLCVSFDLVVAGYVVWSVAQARAQHEVA